jgi:hypothetical protein
MEHLLSSLPLWDTDESFDLATYIYTDTQEDAEYPECVIDVSEWFPGSDLLFLEVVWEDRTDESVDTEHQIELRKKADEKVDADMRRSLNHKPDQVSFYPPL